MAVNITMVFVINIVSGGFIRDNLIARIVMRSGISVVFLLLVFRGIAIVIRCLIMRDLVTIGLHTIPKRFLLVA